MKENYIKVELFVYFSLAMVLALPLSVWAGHNPPGECLYHDKPECDRLKREVPDTCYYQVGEKFVSSGMYTGTCRVVRGKKIPPREPVVSGRRVWSSPQILKTSGYKLKNKMGLLQYLMSSAAPQDQSSGYAFDYFKQSPCKISNNVSRSCFFVLYSSNISVSIFFF